VQFKSYFFKILSKKQDHSKNSSIKKAFFIFCKMSEKSTCPEKTAESPVVRQITVGAVDDKKAKKKTPKKSAKDGVIYHTGDDGFDEKSLVDCKAKGWCFTLNNYTQLDIANINEFFAAKCDYGIFGKEVGASGTPHLQGYVRNKNGLGFNALKKVLPKAHLEIAKGSAEENKIYCSKGEQSKEEYQRAKTLGSDYGKNADVTEYGSFEKQGQRNDLAELRDQLSTGKTTLAEVRRTMDPYAYNNIHRTLYAYENDYLMSQQRNTVTTGVFFFGESGLGKSCEAFSVQNKYVVPDDKGWFDNYTGQENFVIDEIRAGDFSFKFLLQICDRYPLGLRRRNRGEVPFTSKRVIITSCYSIDQLFPDETRETLVQFYRRYLVIRVRKNGEHEVVSTPPKTEKQTKPVTTLNRISSDLDPWEQGQALIQLNQYKKVLHQLKFYSSACRNFESFLQLNTRFEYELDSFRQRFQALKKSYQLYDSRVQQDLCKHEYLRGVLPKLTPPVCYL